MQIRSMQLTEFGAFMQWIKKSVCQVLVFCGEAEMCNLGGGEVDTIQLATITNSDFRMVV